MKTNEELQNDVQAALKWQPLLHAAEIGVTAKGGIVTLSGTVDTYAKKAEAEDAAKNVVGVQAVVEKIDIQFGTKGRKEDSEIATDVVNAFRYSWEIPNDKIKVMVENGWVSLHGELEWNCAKEAAKKAVHNVAGVKGITNDIIVKSHGNDLLEKENVENAIMRNGAIDDEDITVGVSGNKVTLMGTAYSLSQKEEASRIAWNAPGVWEVDNQLLVGYDD
ncbi:MAG: BON domain-containing protein [Chryseolinea sp.]